MEYYEAPDTSYIKTSLPKVFLAGGIGNCPDWQSEVRAMLGDVDVAVLNPRRVSFPTPWTTQNSKEQITWEYDALVASDIIMFWFPGGESVQPIALYELGRWTSVGTRSIVVGADRSYPRVDDVEIQLSLSRPDLHVYQTLASVVEQTARAVRQLARR